MANRHDAMVLHLTDLRALETIKYLLEKKKSQAYKDWDNHCRSENRLISSLNSHQTIIDASKDELRFYFESKNSMLPEFLQNIMWNIFKLDERITVKKFIAVSLIDTVIAFLLVAIPTVLIGLFLSKILFPIDFIINFIWKAVLLIYAIMIIYCTLPDTINVIKKSRNEFENSTAVYVNVQNELSNTVDLINASADIYQKCDAELKKVTTLLNNAYSANIIPGQYRNIHAIYYFHQFISTSNFGLEQAMENYMHQEIANKLDTIIAQMNQLINKMDEVIVNQRETNSRLNKLADDNKKMLSTLASIEKNTAVSAQYSKISASYSAINAYFSAATYGELLKINQRSDYYRR